MFYQSEREKETEKQNSYQLTEESSKEENGI
jgi:hypothetical protein